jgi:hypothetical protein
VLDERCGGEADGLRPAHESIQFTRERAMTAYVLDLVE